MPFVARTARPLGWAALAIALLSLLAALVSGGARSAQIGAAVSIERAWVSAVPIAGHPAAGYLTLIGGAAPDTLVRVSSPGASAIELHASMAGGGMMQMAKLRSVAVPARARVIFAERGRHLMIFGLKLGTKSLPLTFTFASGRTVSVTAPVRAVGGMEHEASSARRTI